MNIDDMSIGGRFYEGAEVDPIINERYFKGNLSTERSRQLALFNDSVSLQLSKIDCPDDIKDKFKRKSPLIDDIPADYTVSLCSVYLKLASICMYLHKRLKSINKDLSDFYLNSTKTYLSLSKFDKELF